MRKFEVLTIHGHVLLHLAQHPEARLRDLADTLEVTERTAHSVVADLCAAGHVVKMKIGRRNRYVIERHVPLPDGRTVGAFLAAMLGSHAIADGR